MNQDLLEKNPGAILILQKASWKKAMLLLSVAQNAHLILRQGSRKRFPWFNWVFYSVSLVPSDETLQPLLDKAKELSDDSNNPCILVESEKQPATLVSSSPGLLGFFKGKTAKFIYVDVDTSGRHVVISFKD